MGTFLVTGGAGFIGTHLCWELERAGHRTRVLDSLVQQAHAAGRPPALPPTAEFIAGDVKDSSTVKDALRGVDGVFHLAAEVGVGQSMYEIERYVGANDLGTAVLFQQILERPVKRVVVASSMSVYGEGLYRTRDGARHETARRTAEQLKAGRWEPAGPDGSALEPIPTDETKRPDLVSVYALSKYVQEQLVMMLGAAYGIEAVALRLFNVFGPGQALSNPYTGVLAIFAGRLLNGQAPLIFEDGRQRRDFVHVEDVARAFHLAMTEPRAAGEIINIGSSRSYSIAEIGELLATAMGRPDLAPQVMNRARAGDIRHCFADIGKAWATLGFEPGRSIEASIDELVAWVSEQQAEDRVGQAHRELEQRGLMA